MFANHYVFELPGRLDRDTLRALLTVAGGETIETTDDGWRLRRKVRP